MWYISKIKSIDVEFDYVSDFTEMDDLYFIVLKNTDKLLDEKILKQSNTIKVDSNIAYVNFKDVDTIQKALQTLGIEYVFGLNLKEKDMFSTTEFGMMLYDLIDYDGEVKLNDNDDTGFFIHSYSLYNHFIIYDADDVYYTTLDRLVLSKECLITEDSIFIFDDTNDVVKQKYKILDKGKFAKLITLKRK